MTHRAPAANYLDIFDDLLELMNGTVNHASRTAPEVSLSAWAQAALHFTAAPDQAAALDHPAHRLILCCNRQWGKTTIAAIKALHTAIVRPGSQIAVLSTSLQQATHFLEKAIAFAAQLGYKPKRNRTTELSLHLPNGSRIFAIANTLDAARGFTADILIIDDAAFLSDPVISSAVSALSRTNGKLWLLSVPNTRTGLFYQVWHSKSLPEWFRVHATIATAPHATPAFLEEQHRLFPLHFRRDFYCEFPSAKGRLLSAERVDSLVDPSLVCPPLPRLAPLVSE